MYKAQAVLNMAGTREPGVRKVRREVAIPVKRDSGHSRALQLEELRKEAGTL